MDYTQFILGMLFGAIGMGYIVYGRKQMNGVALIAGIGLCAFPYFVSNLWLTIAIGAALMALPRFIDW